ncbi:MAG: 4Fe-4S cluster-binding domain-containing protein, partial [Planctomycetes bacterium]|nr:4Fe-4S cluster-binding domain-containing protein [Planctomycetota bacterium]
MPHINKQMASFFLTTKCNLCCSYCYNRTTRAHFNDQSLPFHIAKKGMDYYFSTNENRHIRFYGPGEPTQDFELLKAIVDYGYSTAAGRLTIEIQTNGCFSQNIAEWLLDNLNIIWISVDGEPYIQNTNRPLADGQPSSPIIENNVRYLI